jgi:hypothetical protein
MNDFTKEELELIFRMFHHFIYSPYWKISDNEHELKEKIQSMIDNYCEHELNFLQKETIKQLKSRANDSTCWNLHMRHNGQTKIFEVDFLKDYFRNCYE